MPVSSIDLKVDCVGACVGVRGSRIKNVHLKEFTKKGTDTSLESFRPLLDGTTNWPAVMEAFGAALADFASARS